MLSRNVTGFPRLLSGVETYERGMVCRWVSLLFFGFSKSMHHSAFHQAFAGSLLATSESGVDAKNSEGWVR